MIEECKRIINKMPPTAVGFREYFAAFSGVLTVAYRWFPNPLLLFKKELDQAIPGLKPENPGTKWPKTTIGCLQDDQELSFDDAKILQRICTDLSALVNPKNKLEIDSLSHVDFRCRSLERRFATKQFQLGVGSAAVRDISLPPEWHQQDVAGTTFINLNKEALKKYWEKGLRRPGNRETHYRSDHREQTLVWEIPVEKLQFLEDFISAVDAELPGKYVWFKPESRHMTVRGLSTV